MADTVADVGAAYFDAWKAGDFARLRTILADDATFDGPLGHAGNAEECIDGLKRMSQIVTDIVIPQDLRRWSRRTDLVRHAHRPDRSAADGELAARRERQDHLYPGDVRSPSAKPAHWPVGQPTRQPVGQPPSAQRSARPLARRAYRYRLGQLRSISGLTGSGVPAGGSGRR